MSAGGRAGPVPRTLADASLGLEVTIQAIELDAELAAWIANVGLHEGERVVVLRRAIFGGPLHVRTSSGGEFAVGREVAARIFVEDGP